MIKSKEDASLGYLCSDIDNEGIIIYENNLAPKTYIYEYIDDKNKSTMKAKGIPKYDKSSPLYINGELQFDKKGDIIYKGLLSNNLYENYSECEPVKFAGLRKKNINLTKGDIDKGVKLFSIVNNSQTRTFMKSEWKGMDLIDNKYYPKGYKFN